MPYGFSKNASYELENVMRRNLSKFAQNTVYSQAVVALEDKAKSGNQFAQNLYRCVMNEDSFEGKKFDANIIAQLIGDQFAKAIIENVIAAYPNAVPGYERYVSMGTLSPEGQSRRIERIISTLQDKARTDGLANLVFSGMYGKAPAGQNFYYNTLLSLLESNKDDADLVAKTLEKQNYTVTRQSPAQTNNNSAVTFKADKIYGNPIDPSIDGEGKRESEAGSSVGITDYTNPDGTKTPTIDG